MLANGFNIDHEVRARERHMRPEEHLADFERTEPIGPVLYIRGVKDTLVELSALLVAPTSRSRPKVTVHQAEVQATRILESHGWSVWQYVFNLDSTIGAAYAVDGVSYEVNCRYSGDVRIAFVSCNGQERGDIERSAGERNHLWRRLADQHAQQPFHLLLHGGDQIYADELLDVHPALRAWASRVPAECGGIAASLEMIDALRGAFLGTYLHSLQQAETAWVQARVPSLAMWDDHDICDGWGSIAVEKLDSPVGKALFAVAREFFLVFQLGVSPDHLPDIFLDPTGTSLSWRLRLPGVITIAPDLRSERRPRRVLGPKGWNALEQALNEVEEGRVLLMSSVPVLGPPISWLEAAAGVGGPLRKYQDDLRDQWQSKVHGGEWQRLLALLSKVQDRVPVTVLSGEIHLAARGELDVPGRPIHQLVASGIAHPAPSVLYSWLMEGLARLPCHPLSGLASRMLPLPSMTSRYVAQRNYLILQRLSGEWTAHWEFEQHGRTSLLAI